MTVTQTFELTEWMKANRSWIMGEHSPNLKEIRQRAETMLGFKCSSGSINGVLDHLQIPRRRNATTSRITELEAENKKLRELLVTVSAIHNLPPGIAAQIKDLQIKLNGDVATALKVG